MYLKKTVIIPLLFIVISFFNVSVLATQPEGTGSEFGVSISEYPKNQDKSVGEQGLFFLKVKPNDKQDIKVNVINYSDKNIIVNAELNRALTSNNGSITYDTPKRKDVYNLKENISFYEIASINTKKILLKPKEKKEVIISLKIPKEKFIGMIVGGVYFTQKVDEIATKDQQVINTFAYSIPIQLIESNEKPKIKISFNDIYPSLRDGYPSIEAEINNDTLNFIQKLNVDAKIIDLRRKETVYVSKKNNLKMAPMSILSYGFDLKGSEIETGKYKLEMKIEADGKKEKFEKIFKVEKEEADKLNEESAIIPRTKNNKWLPILIVSLIVLLVAIFFIFWFIKKKKNIKKRISKKKKKTKKK